MSRRIEKDSNALGGQDGTGLARQVRQILASLAIPTVLSACAPVPHVDPAESHATAGKTILYVRSSKAAQTDEDDDAPEDTAKSPPKRLSSVSPANQYIPLSSDIPIFEKILSKYRIGGADTKSAGLMGPPAPATKPFPAKAISLVPLMPDKSLKDGIWERVRRRLMLTAFEHDSVIAEVEKIRHSPGALNFLSKRAEPFLFYIVDEIERRGLPMDLAMVPMVESAFQPNAISPKDAAGIWQFVPGTAADYGLKLVDGYDGRYDVYASTKAALKYLSRLQGMFNGDWLLALAAYNCGEGAVQKAVQANQKAGLGTSFWELNLPAETKSYVPKILALSRVVANPGAHGLNLRKISSLPYLARVEVNAPMPLAQAVSSVGMSWEEFSGLNPAFKPDVAPTPPFNLLLPHDKAQMLVANMQQGTKLVAARKYVVKKGETLTVIAKREGVPPLKLAEWNGLKTDSPVKPGQELIILPV